MNWFSAPGFPISVASILGVAGFILALRDGKVRNFKSLPWSSDKNCSSEDLWVVPGLQNLGNNCFLNVILQALASCSGFRSFLETVVEEFESSSFENLPLAAALSSLLEAMRNRNLDANLMQQVFSISWECNPSKVCIGAIIAIKGLLRYRYRAHDPSEDSLDYHCPDSAAHLSVLLMVMKPHPSDTLDKCSDFATVTADTCFSYGPPSRNYNRGAKPGDSADLRHIHMIDSPDAGTVHFLLPSTSFPSL
ncbi:unnamed protein product [Ilex paraguariensis]|uniref:Peptidase C19 ubiquitin carboxyl-terminal hydrolase domain-containing protein n=1 Tax=Ilex paraguariensis TaxID=185542 RepID=A0ABC8V4M0_9AQUA